MQHLQRAGTQSGGAEGCIVQERQRQSARCFAQECRALAIAHRIARTWVQRSAQIRSSLFVAKRTTFWSASR